MASVMRRIRRGRFWIKPHLETAKREQYEHTKVTIDSGRARKPDLHSCTAGVFNTTYTTHTRSGAAEAGCIADSTGTPSCQQWHCFDDDAGQCFNQPAEATAAKAAWKCEAGQVSREVTAPGRLPGTVPAGIWFGWQKIPSGNSPSPFPWFLLPEPALKLSL